MPHSITITSHGTALDGNSHVVFVPNLTTRTGEEPAILSAAVASTVALRAKDLEETCGIHTVIADAPRGEAVAEFASELEAALQKHSVRRATLVGVGAGASIVQALAVADSKLLRRIVLVDPEARLKPTLSMRIIDTIEHWLPLGLPLRKRNTEFDSRPALHRVGCPTLVLTSEHAGMLSQHQAKDIAARIPNAWFDHLNHAWSNSTGNLSSEFQAELQNFLAIPAKRPQKNLANAARTVT